MTRKQQGFTLIELMIVIAIIAIIAAIAVPNLLSSRVAANESNAISTLRNLVSAQAQFQSTSAMDDDLDGTGEYGCFGELSGDQDLDQRVGGAGLAAPLDPPILGATFQNVDGNGRVNKSGYFFQIFLPDAAGTGVAEPAGGVPSAAWDADNCEIFWAAYGWPVGERTTGNRAFFTNQRGEIIQTKMDVLLYNNASAPVWNAALGGALMGSPLGINGTAATDGNAWTAIQ
ncbi:MAG: hypothetical protein CMJ83_20965 [Planctomycetes bacterium]|nr:hypothetical protein [Planctomycetota bacterium]